MFAHTTVPVPSATTGVVEAGTEEQQAEEEAEMEGVAEQVFGVCPGKT